VPPPTAAEAFPVANDSTLVWYDFEDYFQNAGSLADRSGNGNDAEMIGPVDVTEGYPEAWRFSLKGTATSRRRLNPAAFRSVVSFSLWFRTSHPEDNYKLASRAGGRAGLAPGGYYPPTPTISGAWT